MKKHLFLCLGLHPFLRGVQRYSLLMSIIRLIFLLCTSIWVQTTEITAQLHELIQKSCQFNTVFSCTNVCTSCVTITPSFQLLRSYCKQRQCSDNCYLAIHLQDTSTELLSNFNKTINFFYQFINKFPTGMKVCSAQKCCQNTKCQTGKKQPANQKMQLCLRHILKDSMGSESVSVERITWSMG